MNSIILINLITWLKKIQWPIKKIIANIIKGYHLNFIKKVSRILFDKKIKNKWECDNLINKKIRKKKSKA
jgi:hypothetical protein